MRKVAKVFRATVVGRNPQKRISRMSEGRMDVRKLRKVATAASAVFIGLLGVSNTTSASTCEDVLTSSYQCSYVAEDHTSGSFGATISNPILGDGLFDLLIGGVYLHHCTCNAKGSPLAPTYGQSKNFFCS